MHCITSIGALGNFKQVWRYTWCFVCWNHKQCIALGWSWRGHYKSILEQWLDVKTFPNLRLELPSIMILKWSNSKGLIWSRLLYFGGFMWMHSTTSMLELHATSYKYGDIYNVVVVGLMVVRLKLKGLMIIISWTMAWCKNIP